MGVIDLVIFEHPDRQSTIGGFIFWETGLRKIFSFLLLSFVPVVCMAHTLHVGELAIPLHTTKYTTPSVNFLIDGDVWYLPMVKVEQQNTLHLSYKNDVYTVCRGAERKEGNHYFVGDCLVGVDDNVYLESTGTQYIDTEVFVQRTDTVSLVIDGMFFDARSFNGSNNFNQIITMDGVYFVTSNINLSYPVNIITIGNRDIVSSNWDGNTEIDTLYVNDTLVGQVGWSDVYRLNNICIFAICDSGQPMESYGLSRVRVYSVKVIRDNNMFVRHMIPVPAGMQIGNYTVPSNGMWDVVEQKFYGNSGTGEFVYGVDE